MERLLFTKGESGVSGHIRRRRRASRNAQKPVVCEFIICVDDNHMHKKRRVNRVAIRGTTRMSSGKKTSLILLRDCSPSRPCRHLINQKRDAVSSLTILEHHPLNCLRR